MTRRVRAVIASHSLMLKWIERSLFSVGSVLALWCGVVVARTTYYGRMPVPSPTVETQLRREERDLKGWSRPLSGSWVARLEVPSVGLMATVLEGSDDSSLERAAGHIEDTALPGDDGNVGIAGHRDTIFRPLRRIRVGDPITLRTSTRVLHYRTASTKIVRPTDVDVLDPTPHPTLTLVTCYPFEFLGHAPRRFIVRADLVAAR